MRSFLALFVAAMLASCGGEPADITESPTAFLGVVAPSVSLASPPRVAASPDGNTTWLAWTEGDNVQQALVSARVNSIGVVDRMTVAPLAAGVVRDLQISMIGTTPVLTWRHFRDPNDVTVNAASFRGLDWQMEIASVASAQGADVRAVTLPSGRMSLAWTRLDGAGRFELVAARRGLDGSWSTPALIRTGAGGMVLLRSAQSSDGAGGLMTIWSEAPGVGATAARDAAVLAIRPDPRCLGRRAHRRRGPALRRGRDLFARRWTVGRRLVVGRRARQHGAAVEAIRGRRLAAGDGNWVDLGQDAVLNEMVLTSRNHHVHIGWIGVPVGAATGSVRSAAFDATAGAWSAPSLIGATPRGFPVGLRLRVEHGGTAAAVWSVAQGDGGPFLNKTDAAGAWQAAQQLDPQTAGVGPDVELFSPSDIATTWYRIVAGGVADVVVRRLR